MCYRAAESNLKTVKAKSSLLISFLHHFLRKNLNVASKKKNFTSEDPYSSKDWAAAKATRPRRARYLIMVVGILMPRSSLSLHLYTRSSFNTSCIPADCLSGQLVNGKSIYL